MQNNGSCITKKQSNAPKMWLTQIKLALDGLSFYFDEAVGIIRQDVDETLSLLVHDINSVRKDFPCNE